MDVTLLQRIAKELYAAQEKIVNAFDHAERAGMDTATLNTLDLARSTCGDARSRIANAIDARHPTPSGKDSSCNPPSSLATPSL